MNSKKLLFISFLPYILTLIYAVICAFIGQPFGFTTAYGLEGFVLGFCVAVIFLTVFCPVIPVCLIYQILYIFKGKIKFLKIIKPKTYIIFGFIIIGLLLISLLLSIFKSDIKFFIERNHAISMINRSDEKIPYKENITYFGGILDISEYECSHIFIDYDKAELGFLYGKDNFFKVKLSKTNEDDLVYKHIINDYYIQSVIPLNSPGTRLISFYNDYQHLTIAFLLILNNNTIYISDKINNNSSIYLGLNDYDWDYLEEMKYSQYLN